MDEKEKRTAKKVKEFLLEFNSLMAEMKKLKNINEEEFTLALIEFTVTVPFTLNEVLSDCIWLAQTNSPMPWEIKNTK